MLGPNRVLTLDHVLWEVDSELHCRILIVAGGLYYPVYNVGDILKEVLAKRAEVRDLDFHQLGVP